MVNFRKNCLRILTLILVAFVAVTFTSMMARPVKADGEQTFELVQGASIRKCTDEVNPVYGLKFETKVSASWLAENSADKYRFGTLIFPTYREDNEHKLTVDNYGSNFSSENSLSDNKKNLDAIKFIADMKSFDATADFTYDATITYTYDGVEEALIEAMKAKGQSYTDKQLEDEVKETLKNAYRREFTAISYVEMWSGENEDYSIVYSTNTYTDSMEKVAMRLVDDPTWGSVAKEYLPNGSVTDIKELKGYVVASESQSSQLVVDGFAGVKDFALGNRLLNENDYSLDSGVFSFSKNLVDANLGSYKTLYAFDEHQTTLYVVDVLFANKALETKEDVQAAFELTYDYIKDHRVIKGGTVESNYNTYVLANDIDMTGVVINNIYSIVVQKEFKSFTDVDGDSVYTEDHLKLPTTLGFGGIFDGMGHSLSNVRVGLAITPVYYYSNASGTSTNDSTSHNGFFGRLLQGSQVRNVAFYNLSGTGTVNDYYDLVAPLAFDCEGLLENVYIDIDSELILSRGPIANLGYSAKYKNVVINFPREDYDIVTHLNTETNNRFAYTYGSLYGGNSSAPPNNIGFENVFVSSPMPLHSSKGFANKGIEELNSITYGINEEKIIYDFKGEVTQATVQEAIDAKSTRVYRVNNVRRYDDLYEMAKDSATQSLIDTGYFKIVNGVVAWHTDQQVIEKDVALEFDAYERKFLSTEFDGVEISKVKIVKDGDIYTLTEGNGFELIDNAYVFTVLDSSSVTRNGIPWISTFNSKSNKFSMDVYVGEDVYRYTNLTYWANVISDVNELSTSLSYTGLNNANNYGFYKMDGDIKLTANLSITYWNGNVGANIIGKGFMGQFDGCGHTIDFNNYKTSTTGTINAAKPAGLFGDFLYSDGEEPKIQVTVKNLAVTNFPSHQNDYVFARYTRTISKKTTGTPHFENIYVSYKSSGSNCGALIRYAGTVSMKNVYVDGTSRSLNSYSSHAGYNNGVSGTTFFVTPNPNTGLPRNIYNGGTLFQSLAYYQESASSFENVVSLGYTPLAYQTSHGWWNAERGQLDSTLNEDGVTYTHTINRYGDYYQDYSEFIAYAGNQTVGDVAIKVSIKEKFLAYDQVKKHNGKSYTAGTGLSGAYCTKCYDEFSFVIDGTATCPTCEGNPVMKVIDTKVAPYKQGADMWTVPGVYNWGVEEDLDNLRVGLSGGSAKLNGTYKYNTIGDMKSSGNEFESFLSESGMFNGKSLWKVSEDGELVWHTIPLVYNDNQEINYDVYEKNLQTSKLDDIVDKVGGVDNIVSIVVGSNTLTVENGGIIVDKNGKIIGLKALAEGEAGTNGIPFKNTLNSSTNVFTLTVNTTDDIYVFNNVHYQTMMISNIAELQTALDIDYTKIINNNGFYKLENSIKIETAIKFNYTGIDQNVTSISSQYGFAGVFDGDGYTIDFNNTWIAPHGSRNGLFGNLNHSGGSGRIPATPVTIRDVALINAYAGKVPSLSLFGRYSKNHNSGGPAIIENIYVNSIGDVPGGLFYEPGNWVKYNNVFIDMTVKINGLLNQLPGNYGGIFAFTMRYGTKTLSDNVTNFVALGDPGRTTLIRSKEKPTVSTINNVKSIRSVQNPETGLYTHYVSHGGWSSQGNIFGKEYYYGYYGGNKEYGEVELVQGLKKGFLPIAEKYNKTTAIPGKYCAKCQEFFTQEEGVVTCPTCVVDNEPVALTGSTNLWNETAVFVIGYTKLSDVDHSLLGGGHNGELVFYGAYQYDDTTAMKKAYNDGMALETPVNIFESFVGEDGHGCWAVNSGVLTWVGRQQIAA